MNNPNEFEIISKDEFYNQEDGYEYFLGWQGGNPELFSMMDYCRSKDVVPNITINGFGLTQESIDKLSNICGAVAVSNYGKNSCYGAVKSLTDAGLNQVNIHQILSDETKDQAFDLIKDIKTDSRLKKLNAVVFLSLKQKGRGESYHRMKDEDFKKLIDLCMAEEISFGFDSCTACKFIDAIKENRNFEKILHSVEPCESTLFSSYINVRGNFYPCSFLEGVVEGIDMNSVNDFQDDVWYSEKVVEWRKRLLNNNRGCPVYEV